MIIAQIATMPERERTLAIAVESLRHQVDDINVMRNAPSDGNKFQGLTELGMDDIVVICDDDIRYPRDFINVMLGYLLPGVIVTVMGKVMRPRPIESYYRDALIEYRTFREVPCLAMVEIPGTCGMMFRRSTCPDLDHNYFRSMNSDIWMGRYCRERGILPLVVPHSAEWLGNLMPMLPPDAFSVYGRYNEDDKEMTDLINSFL